MNTEVIRKAALLGICALLSACETGGGSATVGSSGFGEANRQTMMAQVVDPDPQYDAPMETSADHASDAIDRYRGGGVKQPDRVTTK